MGKIGRNPQKKISNLDKLKEFDWIDRQTRALFIEFTLFNPNLNLFSHNLILFEFLPTGNFIKSSQFSPIDLFDVTNANMFTFKIIMNIIYMLFIVIFMVRVIKQAIKLNWGYFKQFYNYIDLAIIAFSWSAFSMYLYRLYESNHIFDQIQNSTLGGAGIENISINLQYITYCNDLLQVFLGFCATFGTIRFIKLLKFNKKIIVFVQAFKNSLKDLASVGLVFILIWLAFVQAIYLIFNDKSAQFATLVSTMETCFQLIFGKFDVIPMIKSNAVLGPIFYILYNVMIVFMLVNMVLTILTDHYNDARLTNDLDKEDPELYNYLKSVLGSLINKKNRNSDKAKPVYHDPLLSLQMKMDLLVNKINLDKF